MKFFLLFFIFLANFCFAIRYQIVYLVGRVEYNTYKSDNYVKANVNDIVENLKVLRTGKNSYVKIISSEGQKFFIYPESTFSLLDKDSSFVNAGQVEFIVEKGYTVKTIALFVGVRGTIFRVSSFGSLQKVVLYSGVVDLTDIEKTQTITLTKGQKIEWDATTGFSNINIQNAELKDLEFKIESLDPNQSFLGVKDAKTSIVPTDNINDINIVKNEEISKDNLVEAKEKKAEEKEPVIEKKEEKIYEEDIKSVKTVVEPKKDKWFSLSLGLGSISKDNYFYKNLFFKTYFKPKDNIKLEFLIPVSIDGRKKVYDVYSWGNYEDWNFSGTSDIINDILLKISYFEFNDRGSLFFLRLGELNDVVIGNSFMVNHFMNTVSIFNRRVGGEIVIDNGGFGVEAFVDNISDPIVIFTNLFLRPVYGVPFIGKFKIGLEIDVDKMPIENNFDNPAFFYVGINGFLPIAFSEFFEANLLLDIGKQGLYYRDWTTRPTSWADGTDFAHFHIFDNYAAGLGIDGKFSKYFTYRLYYSYLHSGFVDSYFDRFFYNKRLERILYLIEKDKDDDHSIKAHIGITIPKLLKFDSGCYYYLNQSNKSLVFLNLKTTDLFGFFIESFYEKLIKGFSLYEYDKDSIFSFGINYVIGPSAYIGFQKFWVYDFKGKKDSKVMLTTYVTF